MKRHARKAYTALKNLGATLYETPDGAHFLISAEDGGVNSKDGLPLADYYREYRPERLNEETGEIENMFGIATAVHKILDENGLYAEWENAGAVGVYDA